MLIITTEMRHDNDCRLDRWMSGMGGSVDNWVDERTDLCNDEY